MNFFIAGLTATLLAHRISSFWSSLSAEAFSWSFAKEQQRVTEFVHCTCTRVIFTPTMSRGRGRGRPPRWGFARRGRARQTEERPQDASTGANQNVYDSKEQTGCMPSRHVHSSSFDTFTSGSPITFRKFLGCLQKRYFFLISTDLSVGCYLLVTTLYFFQKQEQTDRQSELAMDTKPLPQLLTQWWPPQLPLRPPGVAAGPPLPILCLWIAIGIDRGILEHWWLPSWPPRMAAPAISVFLSSGSRHLGPLKLTEAAVMVVLSFPALSAKEYYILCGH